MKTALNIGILIVLLALVWVSITTRMKVNEIATKLGVAEKRLMDSQAQAIQSSNRSDVSAGELTSALRAKLKEQEVSELNVKFQS